MLTFFMALIKRIPDVSILACAGWHVVYNRTISIDSAGVCTGIRTLVDDTGLGAGTVGVEDTLGSAAQVGVAEQSGRTRAEAGAILWACQSSRTTGVGLACIWLGFRRRGCI